MSHARRSGVEVGLHVLGNLRLGRSRPANCYATADAEETSMIESRSKLINAVDDAIVPAVIARIASMTL